MAPAMGLKRSAAAAAGAQTVTLPAPAVRDAVRIAVREAAEASSAPAAPARVPAPAVVRDGVLCLEEVDGRRFSYVVDGPGASVKAKGSASFGASFKAVPLQSPLPPIEVRAPALLDRWGSPHFCLGFGSRADCRAGLHVLAGLQHMWICHRT